MPKSITVACEESRKFDALALTAASFAGIIPADTPEWATIKLKDPQTEQALNKAFQEAFESALTKFGDKVLAREIGTPAR